MDNGDVFELLDFYSIPTNLLSILFGIGVKNEVPLNIRVVGSVAIFLMVRWLVPVSQSLHLHLIAASLGLGRALSHGIVLHTEVLGPAPAVRLSLEHGSCVCGEWRSKIRKAASKPR